MRRRARESALIPSLVCSTLVLSLLSPHLVFGSGDGKRANARHHVNNHVAWGQQAHHAVMLCVKSRVPVNLLVRTCMYVALEFARTVGCTCARVCLHSCVCAVVVRARFTCAPVCTRGGYECAQSTSSAISSCERTLHHVGCTTSNQGVGWDSTAPHRTTPHHTTPHRTAPHRIAAHCTTPHLVVSHTE
jgi:hypothetical protein